MSFIQKCKDRWQIQRDWDFWMIMLTFSLAGMSILSIRKILFPLVGIKASTPFWIKAVIYLALCPPIYQLGLLFFGFLLGQFPFFWEKEKRLARLIFRLGNK